MLPATFIASHHLEDGLAAPNSSSSGLGWKSQEERLAATGPIRFESNDSRIHLLEGHEKDCAGFSVSLCDRWRRRDREDGLCKAVISSGDGRQVCQRAEGLQP
jgi:hypothetical protein